MSWNGRKEKENNLVHNSSFNTKSPGGYLSKLPKVRKENSYDKGLMEHEELKMLFDKHSPVTEFRNVAVDFHKHYKR